jgi:hypothetical protein
MSAGRGTLPGSDRHNLSEKCKPAARDRVLQNLPIDHGCATMARPDRGTDAPGKVRAAPEQKTMENRGQQMAHLFR